MLSNNSLLNNIKRGICLKNFHNEIMIVDSKVLYDDQKKFFGSECPQLIITNDVVSLSATFINSRFKRVFLIDLESIDQAPSTVSIIGSVFDDERINTSIYKCYSRMKLKNCKTSIANSNFSNIGSAKGIIRISSSHAVLQGCNFTDIRSHFNVLLILSRSNASIYGCRFENNRCVKGAAIHASTSVLNLNQSVFKKNRNDDMGGAVKLIENLNVNISWCSFTENYSSGSGGAISADLYSHLNFLECVFNKNKADRFGGAVGLYSYNKASTVNILQCLFSENHSGRVGGAIWSSRNQLLIDGTKCINNTAKVAGAGAAIFASNRRFLKKTVNIRSSCFKGNIAGKSGGAIFLSKSLLTIQNTTFERNIAESSVGPGPGAKGGAIYMLPASKVEIVDSLFKGNMAESVGGSICQINGGSLSIKRTSFYLVSHSSGYRNLGGDLIYSSEKLTLEDVFFQDLDEHSLKNSLMIYTGKSKDIQINCINVTCSIGKDIQVILPAKSNLLKKFAQNAFVFASISCFSCPSYTYSVSAGKSGPNVTSQTHVQCFKCPFGGNCTKGRIKAANNFWGFASENSDKKIHFVACPFGYGCFGSSCSHYASCRTGRRGILCGQCQIGLTENMVTSDCLSSHQCLHPGFWLVVLIIGIVYVLSFLFLKEIANFLTTMLVPKSIRQSNEKNTLGFVKNILKNLLNRNLPAQLLMDDISFEPPEPEDVHPELLETSEYGNESMNNSESNAALFPGLFKIIIFFYQTCVLFKVFSAGKSHGLVHIIQEAIATVFNLRTDGVFSQDISWCPFDNLQPVPKLILKTSFIMYLFAIIFLIFIVFRLFKSIKNNDDYCGQTFYSRIYCCVMRLLLISYSTMTVTCFSLLSCVNLGSMGKVLFIDGSIQCYKWWQFIVITIVCIWIASLPVAIYATSWLLRTNKLSTDRFLLLLLLPFPAIIYCLYIRFILLRGSDLSTELQEQNELNESAQEMLNLLEGPFRSFHGTKSNSTYRLSWESILIARRFVLILIKTFVFDTLIRLYLMLFFIILFFMHHIYVRPFACNFLNLIEMISLGILTGICALNILPAFIYMNPLAISFYIQNLANVFRQIETILMLVFPSIIGCIVAILVTVRVFQFLVWMCRLFVRLIRYCCKRKIS